MKIKHLIWCCRSVLMSHCECPEEGTRNVVAECLGKLTLIDPPGLLPKLKSYLRSHSSLTRSTVVTAVKFTISDQVNPAQILLSMIRLITHLHCWRRNPIPSRYGVIYIAGDGRTRIRIQYRNVLRAGIRVRVCAM